jgi:hypothetical protein
MKMPSFTVCVLLLSLVLHSWAFEAVEKHHHKHHKHHKGKHHHHKGHHRHHSKNQTSAVTPESNASVESNSSVEAVKLAPSAVKVVKPTATVKAAPAKPAVKITKDEQLVEQMKVLELKLAQKKKSIAAAMENGHLLVMGPLPKDFTERFAQAVAAAVTVDPKKVTVTKTAAVKDQPGVMAVDFKAPPKVVKDIENQATNPDSRLAQGNLHSFLVAKGDDDEASGDEKAEDAEPKPAADSAAAEASPVQEKGIDIDTAMPYGDLEPFGREDTAQELTEDSVQQSDEMVDQLERAEVAEEKRAVFRALTRLRGAAITSYDGIARSQTGNIDEYNHVHKWRQTHPLHHLADEESDVSKWAFPDNAD